MKFIVYRLLSFIKFLITSTDQHGVHSPFMYNYVTKCLYAHSALRQTKAVRVLLKSMDYLKANNVRLPPRDVNLIRLVKNKFPQIDFTNSPYDILFFSGSEYKNVRTVLSRQEYVHNGSLILLEGIHRNKHREAEWHRIIDHKNARITVDMFYCGAIFFREEQAEQHFKIRI